MFDFLQTALLCVTIGVGKNGRVSEYAQPGPGSLAQEESYVGAFILAFRNATEDAISISTSRRIYMERLNAKRFSQIPQPESRLHTCRR